MGRIYIILLITFILLAAQIAAANETRWPLELIRSPQAVDILQKKKTIVIAVVDTGLDINHEKLKNNIWTNRGEAGLDANGKDKSTNGIDDDKNGFIDDVHGWSFWNNSNQVTDNHGHGTHVSGIITAVNTKENSTESPLNTHIQIMPLKYCEPSASSVKTLENTIKAFEYAIAMGADIINYSGGGADFNIQEYSILKIAEQKGIVVVAAAGNEGANADEEKYFPASYDLSNIISVAALDQNNKLIPVSNFGPKTVHIAAPGFKIFSTLPKNQYGYMTGTSQATAFATGAIALLMAQVPDLKTPQSLRAHLTQTGSRLLALQDKTKYGVALDAYKSLTRYDRSISAFGAIAQNSVDWNSELFSSELDRVVAKSQKANEQALQYVRNLKNQLAPHSTELVKVTP